MNYQEIRAIVQDVIQVERSFAVNEERYRNERIERLENKLNALLDHLGLSIDDYSALRVEPTRPDSTAYVPYVNTIGQNVSPSTPPFQSGSSF